MQNFQDNQKDVDEKDGIVLFAKEAGITSFSSLNSIKKALNTKKVGHTGTLDSFAQGLLIACTGRLTRIAGLITEFDKTYMAVIKFSEETDTCEYTGKITKTSPLPKKNDFENAVKKFTGTFMQKPPVFSAIHINGERASNLARSGKEAEIPMRKVTVFSSRILNERCNEKDEVEFALVEFSVSKGTYIRSLAVDIGRQCGSAAHLVGLYRTKIGNFKIEDAAGFSRLNDFSIEQAIVEMNEQKQIIKNQEELRKKMSEEKDSSQKKCHQKQKFIISEEEKELQEEIRQKKVELTPQIAAECGFSTIFLADEKSYEDFKNGKPLRRHFFAKTTDIKSIPNDSETAVFSPQKKFAGILKKDENDRFKYKFVVN